VLLGAAASSSSTRVLSLIMGFCPFACTTNLTSCRQMSSCVVNVPFAIHKAALIISLSILLLAALDSALCQVLRVFAWDAVCIPLTTPLLISYPIFQQLGFCS